VTDYHDFTTIETAEAQRRRLGVGDIWINAARCDECGDYVRSRNRHDFVTCECGNVSVDGGSWYARRAVGEGARFTNEIVPYADVIKDMA
jgi:ribosomal protein L37AE/L43A